MAISIASKLSGEIEPKMAAGRPSTIQILKILLPIMLPTRSSFSCRRAAVMVVTSSGRDVPRATMVRAMMRSEIPMAEAMVDAESTTNWLPATTPTRPIMVISKDFSVFHLGFSTSFLELRPFLIILKM